MVHARPRRRRRRDQGDQIAGCTPEQARLALVALARIHAPVINDLGLGASDWLNQPNPLNQDLVTQLLARVSASGTRNRSPTSTPLSASASCRRSTAGSRTADRRSAWSTATTVSTTCCSPTAPAPRRLADGELGTGDERRGVLPRHAAERSRIAARTRKSSSGPTTDQLLAQGVEALHLGGAAGRATGGAASGAW